ncbi:MAG TPA: hypothetical protein VFE23_11725 [Usitatibacter sp.]|jgi:hypothetical protein|nr:hypothetical protein [Usitatibacter sp.]
MDIELTIEPAAGVTKQTKGQFTVEVNYQRTVSGGTGTSDNVPSAASAPLGDDLKASLILEEADSAEGMVANVLGLDGASLLSKAPTVAAKKASLTLTREDLDQIEKIRQRVPAEKAPLATSRTARLVATGGTPLDYSRASVEVVPIADAAALARLGIDALSSDPTRSSALEVTGQDLGRLSGLAWLPTHLAIDGTISATFVQARTLGWLWWLNGDCQVVGFVPDDLSVARRSVLLLALPVILRPIARITPTSRTRTVPADVTEAELADNPDVYTEDPGTMCHPFSNPERVLSERSFEVIARVTQPEIGPLGSIRTRSIDILNLDGEGGAIEIPAPAARPPRASRATARTTPRLPVPARPVPFPRPHPLPVDYVDLVKRMPAGRGVMSANNPLQWEDDIAQYQAATLAIGHILQFRVRWRSNGYSLGNVAKTLTLAPRQARRIQKIEWQRVESASRSETTQLRDQENDSTVRERDYNDRVAANLSEWASGRSSSDSEGIAGGIGGVLGSGVLGAIGGGAGSAHSSSHQNGGRTTTASEIQRLRDAIRQHGDALRRLESTVVQEVSQEEDVTGTTEVVRNLNYSRSLTIIFYQILRHLKVTTDFAGVRECIFVPFAIKPFDLQRAYRWRESLQAAIRAPEYLEAMRHLKDVLTNFSTSDIAPGSRAAQPLKYLRGSIYVSLGLERPPDPADGLFNAAAWRPLQPLLSTPAQGVHSLLGSLIAAQRDPIFQAEHAPAMAARWANQIHMRVGNRVLHADSTLASRYQFNRSVRIDFTIPESELAGLTRQALQQITVVPERALQAGSVANLTRISFTYNTERFEHTVEGRTGTNDLVTPDGAPSDATVSLPLDDWERVDEQLEIRRSVASLLEHLNEHVEYYHKAIWWRMDRDRLMMLLDGFYVPNTNNVSIASVVDREPVGVIGNCLVYRVGAASFLGLGKIETPAELYNLYALTEPPADPLLVSLPTDGLYAQSIMDSCPALEEHYGNTDWALNAPDLDLGQLDPSLLQSRAGDTTPATMPTPFPASIINFQNAPEAPAPSGLAGVLNAVTNPNAFRDMAGLAGTQANAAAALTTAAGIASNLTSQASALEMAKLAQADHATRTADQKIASIKTAVDKGLTSPGEAARVTSDVLGAMNPNPSPKSQAPHESPAITDAIQAARNSPQSTIEANTSQGSVKVSVGNTPTTTQNRNYLWLAAHIGTWSVMNLDTRSGKQEVHIDQTNLSDSKVAGFDPPARDAIKFQVHSVTFESTLAFADLADQFNTFEALPDPQTVGCEKLVSVGAGLSLGDEIRWRVHLPPEAIWTVRAALVSTFGLDGVLLDLIFEAMKTRKFDTRIVEKQGPADGVLEVTAHTLIDHPYSGRRTWRLHQVAPGRYVLETAEFNRFPWLPDYWAETFLKGKAAQVTWQGFLERFLRNVNAEMIVGGPEDTALYQGDHTRYYENVTDLAAHLNSPVDATDQQLKRVYNEYAPLRQELELIGIDPATI